MTIENVYYSLILYSAVRGGTAIWTLTSNLIILLFCCLHFENAAVGNGKILKEYFAGEFHYSQIIVRMGHRDTKLEAKKYLEDQFSNLSAHKNHLESFKEKYSCLGPIPRFRSRILLP